MKKSGYADLPLHSGRVPQWLAERMAKLGGAIVESIALSYGKKEVLTRLSDPLWFQALGCVMGMDWHSSGITTSVLGALKRAVNPMSQDLGIYVCGGRGKHSRKTPDELLRISDHTGLDGNSLVHASRLTARVDNNAVQDGFQIYLHSFVLTDEGDWIVVQQGMNGTTGMARRYHWHSANVCSFVEEPHTAIVGENQGIIMNLVDRGAERAREGIVNVLHEHPEKTLRQARKLIMPRSHDLQPQDIDLKRLGSVLALGYERDLHDFANVLLLEGLGPRTLQSLALVTEVIHGAPTRFSDPARFAFAHGGKDGKPFPVPTKVYDETIHVLRTAIDRAKLGRSEKMEGLKRLNKFAERIEKQYHPEADLQKVIDHELSHSAEYEARSVVSAGGSRKGKNQHDKVQLKLF